MQKMYSIIFSFILIIANNEFLSPTVYNEVLQYISIQHILLRPTYDVMKIMHYHHYLLVSSFIFILI